MSKFSELFEEEIKVSEPVDNTGNLTPNSPEDLESKILARAKSNSNIKKETIDAFKNVQEAPYGQNYSIDKTKVPEVKPQEIKKEPTALGGFIEKTIEAAKGGISKATERIQPKLNENPLLGPVGKEINKVVEKSYSSGITSALESTEDSLQRVGDFTEIMQTNAPTAEKVGKGISAGLGVANTLFIPITSTLAAAKEIPVVGEYPVKGVELVFGKMGEAGAFVGTSLVNNLPISDQSKEALMQPVSELTGLIAMMIGGGALHVGGKKVTEVVKTKIAEGKLLSPEWKAKVAKATGGEEAVKETMGNIKAKIIEKTADRQANGIEITPAEGLKIVNETVKEIPIESKTPEILKVRTPEESVEVVTTKRAVFDNLIKNQEDIDYKVVKDLGTTPSGAKIGARYEFDYKTGKSTILTTKATTGANLAQEIGHYIDHKLSMDINNRFSDIIPNYRANRGEVERTLSGYALEKLDGTATSKQISKEVKRLVDSFNTDIDKLAVKETRVQKSEKFASAVREVLMNEKKASRIAPEFTAFIKYFNEKKGIIANVIKETKKTQKKIAEDTLLEEYLKNKNLKFRTENNVNLEELKNAGVQIDENNIATVYRGGNVSKEKLSNLRYGDYLSSVKTGKDVTGNSGASEYGKNIVELKLPTKDLKVENGEIKYIGESKSLEGGLKYSKKIYKALNDVYGSNYTAKEIDAMPEKIVRDVASQGLEGGRNEFDKLLKNKKGEELKTTLKPLYEEAKKYKTVEEFKKSITPKQLRELLNKTEEKAKTASARATGATKREAGDYYYSQDRGAFNALLDDIKNGRNLNDPANQKLTDIWNEANNIKTESFRIKDDFEKVGIKLSDAQETEIIKLNKKLFGDENVKITEQILTPEGQTALGSYKNSIIKILDGQANAKDTLYHEAVHKYFDVFTTTKEQGELLKVAKEKFGTKDYAETEEVLAEKFIQYAKGKEVKGLTDVIKNSFDSIISRIKKFLGNEDKIKTLYDDILAGKAKKISETGLSTKKFVETKAFNPDKINAPQDIQNVFEGISKASDQFKEQRISKSNEDIKALANEVGVTVEDLLKVKPGSIANAETIYKARQLVADLAQDLRDTTRELTTETATPAQMKEFKIKLLRLQGAMKTVAGFRTEAAHIFRQFQLESVAGEFDIMKDMLSELKKVDAKAADDITIFTKGAKELVEPTLADKAWHLWYMSILSGETTQIKNAFGNMAQMITEVATEATVNPKGLPNAVSGLYQGLLTGFKKGTEILKEGDINKFEERGRKPIKFTMGAEKATGLSKTIRQTGANILNAFDYVGRFMSATDALFREGFRGMELRSLAREQAIKEGYKGDALKERIDDIVRDPMEKILEEADQFAQRGTYTQKPAGVLGAIASGMSGITTKVPALKLVVPFTRIVANVANNSLDWTPVGYKRAFFPGKGIDLTSRQRSKAIARATLGTVAMTYFSTLAADENLSGNGPSDSDKRNQLQDSGWRPNSIKIGNKWYPYQNWGPMAIPMALVGNYFDSIRYGNMTDKNALERATAGVLGSANSILSMSFLSGTADLLSAMQNLEKGGAKYFERFIANQATSPVPNLYKQTARYFDTTVYETPDIKAMILNNLRITGGLKPKLNVFGEATKGDTLSQLSPSEITKDPVKKFLSENEIWVSVPSKNTNIKTYKDPKGRKMTEDEYYNYVKYSGIEIKKRLKTQLQQLQQIPEDKRQDYVNSIVDSVRKGVKGGIQMGLYK